MEVQKSNLYIDKNMSYKAMPKNRTGPKRLNIVEIFSIYTPSLVHGYHPDIMHPCHLVLIHIYHLVIMHTYHIIMHNYHIMCYNKCIIMQWSTTALMGGFAIFNNNQVTILVNVTKLKGVFK